jgi:hypothetical protein
LILLPSRGYVNVSLAVRANGPSNIVDEREARKGGGGELVKGPFEQQIVLTCEDCGEKLVLFGPEEDWRSRRAVFVCGSGHRLTLDGRADEEVLVAS